MDWYIHRNDEQQGPFTTEALSGMVQSGALSEDDLAWHEGLPEWAPLGSIPDYHSTTTPAAAVLAAKPAMARSAVPLADPAAATAAEPVMHAGPVRAAGQATPSLMLGALGGTIAAAVSGAVWALVAIYAGLEIGWLAIGIGALCGFAVVLFSRGGHGAPFQFVAVATSLLGILIGKYAAFVHGLRMYLAEQGIETAADISLVNPGAMRMFFENPSLSFGGFDILWMILAVSAAWRIASGATTE